MQTHGLTWQGLYKLSGYVLQGRGPYTHQDQHGYI